jgi:hypothetical protein
MIEITFNPLQQSALPSLSGTELSILSQRCGVNVAPDTLDALDASRLNWQAWSATLAAVAVRLGFLPRDNFYDIN